MIVPWKVQKSGDRLFVNNGVFGYFIDKTEESEYLMKILKERDGS